MNIIFCASYLNIPDTIDSIERNNASFRVISTNTAIIKLFGELYSPENVIQLPLLFTHLRNPYKFVSDLILFPFYKRKYLSKLANLYPQKIIFFFTGLCGFESWIIKKLSKKAVVFYKAQVDRGYLPEAAGFRIKLKTKLLSIIFGVPFVALMYGDREIICAGKKYFEILNAKPHPPIADQQLIVDFFLEHYPALPDYDVLVLVGKNYNIDDYEYKNKIQLICQELLSICKPQKIAIKQHPNNAFEYLNLHTDFINLPKILPANMLCAKSKVVISYTSGTLHEAANMGKTAISLIYIIKSTYSDNAKTKKNMFIANTENGYQVEFPKSIDEFMDICRNAL